MNVYADMMILLCRRLSVRDDVVLSGSGSTHTKIKEVRQHNNVNKHNS